MFSSIVRFISSRPFIPIRRLYSLRRLNSVANDRTDSGARVYAIAAPGLNSIDELNCRIEFTN